MDNLRVGHLVCTDEDGPEPVVVLLDMKLLDLVSEGLVVFGFVSHGRAGKIEGGYMMYRSTENFWK